MIEILFFQSDENDIVSRLIEFTLCVVLRKKYSHVNLRVDNVVYDCTIEGITYYTYDEYWDTRAKARLFVYADELATLARVEALALINFRPTIISLVRALMGKQAFICTEFVRIAIGHDKVTIYPEDLYNEIKEKTVHCSTESQVTRSG